MQMVICVLIAVCIFISGIQTVQAAAPALNKTSVILAVNESVTLKVENTNKKVTWSSSDKKIAIVKNGKVTAKKAGSAKITAKIGKQKFSCKVTVGVLEKKILKKLSGKWDKDGEQGLPEERYAIFTPNYIKWYYDGQLSYKSKIMKVKKKSAKKYIFFMESSDGYKFRYEAHVKNGKFDYMTYYGDWSGQTGYSASSSIHRIS